MVQRPGGSRRALIAVLAIAIALLIALASSSRFYTDFLWFKEIGLTSVLWKSLGTQAALGLIVGIAVAVVFWFNLWLAQRLVPAYRIGPIEDLGRSDPLDQYRETLGPYTRWIRLGIALFAGIVGGIAASASWQVFLLWINRVSFGIEDPQFQRDVGFYVFQLPMFDLVLSWLWVTLIFTIIVVAAAHFFFGAIRLDRGLAGMSSGSLAHISALLALLALVKAGQYWLGRFQLNFSPRGTVDGASYTDVNAQLPALTALTVISVIAAVLFLVNIRFRRVSLPVAAVAIWILTAVLAGGVWPFWVQRFSVEPQELQREAPFIQRNIDATRAAFGIEDVRPEFFPASTELTGDDLEENEILLQNVRLWDPDILQTAYSQLQAIRTYYQFVDVDIDRYSVDGDLRQILLSPRELEIENLPPNSQTWPNLHLGYTHGFGVAASLANESTTAGQPQFLVKDVPGQVREGAESLNAEQPRIYYGEGFDSAEYSVVDSGQAEIDFPTDEGVERIRYDGDGGIPIDNLFKRLVFAFREGDPNLVLSSLITGESQILLYRNVRERVRRAAPFLALDQDPYITVIDGKMKWIVDAYTSTRWYPYSQHFEMNQLLQTTERGVLSGRVNYVRNSVKVIVDAYDGTMDFHVVDPSDPMIQAWGKAFPELFDAGEPSDDLRAHFRYPEDLFTIQSEVFLAYHMTDPANFYQREDEWSVAVKALEPGEVTNEPVEPTYLLFKLPDQEEQEFMLTRPFTPRAKNNLIAILVGRSDPENYGELVTLDLPRQEFVTGPQQISNLINQDVQIARTLTLLRQEGSRVLFGSLVILPIEESLLYIQPMFVAASDLGIPELKRVIVVFGEEVVMEENFDQALAAIFDLETAAPKEPGVPTPPPPPPGEQAPPEVTELIAEANEVFQRANDALARGDFAAYGRLIERLGDLLEQLEQRST